MTYALDCESTGTDIHHGARPFFVTVCHDDGSQVYYEWSVDPLTRQVQVPPADVIELNRLLARTRGWGKFAEDVRGRHCVVGQNIRFDAKMLQAVGVGPWPWDMTQDTLISAHLLASNHKKDLTSLAVEYLGLDILPAEKALEQAVQKARRIVQQARLRRRRRLEKGIPLDPADATQDKLADWQIAEKGRPDMPSAGGDAWRGDYWLPRALVQYLWETSEAGIKWQQGERRDDYDTLAGWEYRPPDASGMASPGSHPWWTVLRDYANHDSSVTMMLWPVMEEKLRRRGLWAIYRERMKVLPVVVPMETRGVTVNLDRLRGVEDEFREESGVLEKSCLVLAGGYQVVTCGGCGRQADPVTGVLECWCGGEGDLAECSYRLDLPRAGNNKSLVNLVFGLIRAPAVKRSEKTGQPSLDKETVDHYCDTLPERSRALRFMEDLRDKRKRDKALADMATYRRYLLPLPSAPGWFNLYPNLNVTGTDTLRMSSDNPNSQSVSKQGDFTLRAFFGPSPGREWYSLDYENIELRISAYESGERCMIELFERPNDPPYFGSYHLLNASIIYPDLFWPLAEEKGAFKDRYESTWYRYTKFFGFSMGYGGQEKTCDRSARKRGAYALVKDRLKEHSRLNQKYVDMANRLGYVETLPDRTVCPERGYPILCSRSDSGRVKPTVPLNYHVQSTAMWCTCKAMVRCHEALVRWSGEDGQDYRMAMQVHDEIVFDFPEGLPGNQAKVEELRRLMGVSGDDVGVPLTVSVGYHPDNWHDKERPRWEKKKPQAVVPGVSG